MLAHASRKWNAGGRERTRAEVFALFGTAFSAFPLMFLARQLAGSNIVAYGLAFLLTMIANWFAQRKFAQVNSASLAADYQGSNSTL